MSSSEEIQEVFEQDIAEKTRIIGVHKLLDCLDGFQVKDFPENLVSATDRDLLRRIFEKDKDWQQYGDYYTLISEEDKKRLGEIICKIADAEAEDG